MRGPTLVIATAIVLAVCAPAAGAPDQSQELLNQRAQRLKNKQDNDRDNLEVLENPLQHDGYG